MFWSGLSIRARSAWSFVTSGTGGVGIEFVAASGGTVVLADPQARERRFRYGAAGGGLSWGIRKLPKLGRLDTSKLDPRGLSDHFSGNVAPQSFWNHGSVWLFDGFKGKELTVDDFSGICLVFDAGGGLILGYSGAAMLVGIDPIALATVAMGLPGMLLGPSLDPKAVILSRGWNVGPQASVGATGQVGYLWHHG